MRTFVSCDDLHDIQAVFDYLVPLREAIPQFKATAYAIPNKLGPVHQWKHTFNWLTFAIHGWEHVRSECLSWTDDLAAARLQQAMEMGYAPAFKAPNYATNDDTEVACNAMGVILHHDHTYSPKHISTRAYPGKGKREFDHELITTHLQNYKGSRDFIAENRKMTVEYLSRFDEFVSILDLA